MTNHDESNSYNREVRQDSYTSADGNIHTNVTRTSETVENNADKYEDGYVSGRIQERDYQRRNLAARDSNNAAGGLVLGVMLAALATLVGGAMWYLNQSKEAENATPTPIETPVTTDTNELESEVSQPPQNNTTTIIERTKEVAVPVPVEVPVPQEQAPAPEPQQRDININVQPQEGGNQSETQTSTPQKQTTPKQPQSSSDSSNNSSSETEAQNQTNPTSNSNSSNNSDSNSSTNAQ
jgi:hypothetical protein